MRIATRPFPLAIGLLLVLLLAVLLAMGWYHQRWLDAVSAGEVGRRTAELEEDLERFKRSFNAEVWGWHRSMVQALPRFLRGQPMPWSELGVDLRYVDAVAVGVDNKLTTREWARRSRNLPVHRPELRGREKVWATVPSSGEWKLTDNRLAWERDQFRSFPPLPIGFHRLRPIGVGFGASGEGLALESTMAAHMSFGPRWGHWADSAVRDYEVTLSVRLDWQSFVDRMIEDRLRSHLRIPFDDLLYHMWWEWKAVQSDQVDRRFNALAASKEFFKRDADTHFDAEVTLLQRIELPEDVVLTQVPIGAASVDDLCEGCVPSFGAIKVEVDFVSANDAVPTWRLGIRHARGSLAAAVASEHRRRLAMGAAGLMVAAFAGLLLVGVAVRSQRLARMQGDFASSISHELRSPLAVIHSAAANLSDGTVPASEQATAYGRLIRGESNRLRGLIDRVLLLAHLRTDGQSLEAVELRGVVEAALAPLAPEIERQGLETTVTLGEPRAVRAEPVALDAAIQNLVDNAVKHGGSGGRIAIEANEVRRRRRDWVVLSVHDWGPGIEVADRRRIFAPFFRGRRAREHQIPGSGIGLDLASRIARAFGGRIVAEPRADGLTMHLWLQAAADEEAL